MYTLPLNAVSRLIWAVIGGGMMVSGVRRRSLWDTACGTAGAGMLIWAFAAPSAPEATMRDIVDISSEDSFPASDPPSSW
jgi:hypothetical protein